MEILVSCDEPLHFPRGNLEDDIDEILGDLGEVSGGGQGLAGWDIEIEIFDADDVSEAIRSIMELMKTSGVPQSTTITHGDNIINIYES